MAKASVGLSSAILDRITLRKNKTKYEVETEIARGGMGAIFRVWDEDLRRPLAMKTILANEDGQGEQTDVDPQLLQRFLDEAQVTGQLDHPGVVPVHELGVDAEGTVYFTMRLVRGLTLLKVLDLAREEKQGWSVTRVLDVLVKVCDTMAYAHSKHVIHRDLKPANIMVGRFGEVYVMDWGVAKILGHADQHDLRPRSRAITAVAIQTDRSAAAEQTPNSPIFTMDGMVVGTPSYMSPEQAHGMVDEMDARSDVYAIGAMLYQLLSGSAPYVERGSHPSPHAVLFGVMQGPPKPLNKVAKHAPPELIAICERAMARKRCDRYENAHALAHDVRAFLEERVVEAYQTGAWAEFRMWTHRNKGLSFAIAVGLGIIAAMSMVFARRISLERDVAQHNENEANKQAAIASENASIAMKNETLATEHLREVLDLSVIEQLDSLRHEARHDLWPVEQSRVPAMTEWLARARPLEAVLGKLEGRLARLEAVAIPRTPEQVEQERRAHSSYDKLLAIRRQHQALTRSMAMARGEITPEPFTLDEHLLPAESMAIQKIARPLVRPERTVFGREAEGLALARAAVEAASTYERASAFDTLSWAFFANGNHAEALRASQRALDVAPADLRARLDDHRRLLRTLLDKGEETLAAEIALLEAQVAMRRDWVFPEDAHQTAEGRRWRHRLLSSLIGKLRNFLHTSSGGGDAAGFWSDTLGGIEQREAMARAWHHESIQVPHAKRLWADAVAYARSADSPYRGLELRPIEGFLPLLPVNRRTKLLEFVFLPTGTPPELNEAWFWQGREPAPGHVVREPSRWKIRAETGMVFVLLPGR